MAGDIVSMVLSSGQIKISLSTNFWKKTWDEREVHIFILFSLFLQIYLIFSAASRKRSKSFFLRSIWFSYLLADWAASYCVGLISSNQKYRSDRTTRNHLLAFWSPFLLLHLGGPDTITAYALEDNELWLRHLLGLIFQSITTAYIFFLSFQNNYFVLPSLLVSVAGLIKYGERTRALYKASFNSFRQSLVPDPGPDYGKLMEEFFSQKRAGLPARIITVPEPETKRAADDDGSGRSEEQIDELEAIRKGYYFFTKFKGLYVDMIYTFDDRDESRQYFIHKKAEQVLQVLEIELNFMYEAFYTKIMIVRRKLGHLCKFVSFGSVLLALFLFAFKKKHGLDRFDIGVTYVLLGGALALDIISILMLIVTEYTVILPQESQDMTKLSKFQIFKKVLVRRFYIMMVVGFFTKKRPKWETINDEGKLYNYKGYEKLSTPKRYRRWFGSVSGFNLMQYCLGLSVEKVPYNLHRKPHIQRFQRRCFKIVISVQDGFYKVAKYCGFGDLMDILRFEDKNPLLKKLWEYIFEELKSRSKDVGDDEDAEIIKSMCNMRGEWIMERELGKDSREGLMPFVDSNQVAFDESLILWHIASLLCYHCEEENEHTKDKRHFSMILSDYLIYLLMMQPIMMSSVVGIGQIRFQTTCEEAKMFFRRRKLEEIRDKKERLEKACQDIMEVLHDVKAEDLKREWSISLLFDACRLAKELNKLGDNKWNIIAGVWVELLSFAAIQCRPTAHVKVLSEGGELLSLVWLLMVHLGLGNFQFRAPKTKLLIGKPLP